MRVISVINYKGGVGKTTVTANLGAELARLGKKVLLVDLDPQANLTFSFVGVDHWREELEERRTIRDWYDAFLDNNQSVSLQDLIVKPTQLRKALKGKLDMLCSHLELINVDLELAPMLSGTVRSLKLNSLRVLSRLQRGLQALPSDAYDFVLIDCPPNFNVVTQTAIVASNFLLMPSKADYLSTLGLDQLTKHVGDLVKRYNQFAADAAGVWQPINPMTLGVLFTMVSYYRGRPVRTLRQYIEDVSVKFKMPCLKTIVRENKTLFGDAEPDTYPVVLRAVSGKTHSGVVRELKELTKEILAEVER